ncbi:MAG: glycosyltransferase family 2 protein [Planctomycetota bacterium]
MTTPLDIIILTHNEAANLPHALDSLTDAAPRVFIVDSGSTDATPDIARAHGATLVHNPWPGYAAQRNWALANLPLESPWTMFLDADELVLPELRDEIDALLGGEPEHAAYYVNRYFIFMGARIRRCGYYPSWNIRLFRRGVARYEDREVHEHVIVDGSTGYLSGHLHHEDRRGLEHYIAKHNRYATLEAREIFKERHNLNTPPDQHGRGGRKAESLTRSVALRRFLKRRVLPAIPAPFLFRFLYMYILKLGILDGRAGFHFCTLIAAYDLFVSLNLKELERLARQHDPQTALEHARPSTGLAEHTP